MVAGRRFDTDRDEAIEVTLLLQSLGDGADETVAQTARDLSGDQWPTFVNQAIAHKVGALLYRRLRMALGTSLASADRHIASLRSVYVDNALRSMTTYRQLGDIVSVLQERDIDVIALKGVHLAASVYAEPALRPMNDIDLLVKAADLSRAEHTLLELGYVPWTSDACSVDFSKHQHRAPLMKSGAIPVELHSSIVPHDSPFDIEIASIWSRARACHLGRCRALVLSPEDLILHLCLHASYIHRFRIALLSLCDLAIAIERHRPLIDWPQLATTANAAGAGRFVYSTLRLVQTMLGARIPSSLFEHIDHDGADDEIVAVIRQCIMLPRTDLPSTYEQLIECDGFADTIRTLARGVMPPPERLRGIYHVPRRSRKVYWYYLFRPFDLLVRRGKIAAAIALRTRRMRSTVEWRKQRPLVERWVKRGHGSAR